jgi:hypothetical protein
MISVRSNKGEWVIKGVLQIPPSVDKRIDFFNNVKRLR